MSNDCVAEGRIGRFRLAIERIRNGDCRELLALFGNFIVMETVSSFVTNTIEYTAYSPLFGSVADGDVIPSYQLVISVEDTEEGKEYTFSAVKVNSESAAIAEDSGGAGTAQANDCA